MNFVSPHVNIVTVAHLRVMLNMLHGRLWKTRFEISARKSA
jgi:hypothetical protein